MGNFETVLTSSVIAGIISALFSFLNIRKSNDLQYITGERKEWRIEIRNIAKSIINKDKNNIQEDLTELKVRINPNGIVSNDDYTSDAHIWKVIYSLEEPKSDNEFNNNKLLLIEYLSLLLKDDWERCKIEIRGDKLKIFIFIMSFIISIATSLCYLYYWKETIGINYVSLILLVCLIPNVIPYVNYKTVFYKDTEADFNNIIIDIKNIKNFQREYYIKISKRVAPLLIITAIVLIDIYKNSYVDINQFIGSLFIILALIVMHLHLCIIENERKYVKNCLYATSITYCKLRYELKNRKVSSESK